MIGPSDLTGVDTTLALRIIAVARAIAPRLDALEDGDRTSAVAILVGVAAEARVRGSRMVKAQRIGPASVDYSAAESWFSADDRAALRALGVTTASSGPLGHFPRGGILGQLWPEDYS